MEFCILSGTPEAPQRWPVIGWLDGSVDDLAACIELAALSENSVVRGMQILEAGIHQAGGKLRDACADTPDTLEAIAQELHQKDGEQTSRMAMAILANALTFQSSIAGAHRIGTLDQLRGLNGRPSKAKVLNLWRHILTDINYWPIFKIASDILRHIRNGTAQDILDRLFEVAAELDSLGATSQHDLCGRMFQRLITDRKFLATFYTLPSSATLLAELAVSRLDIDWSDRHAVAALRIGDFACGTGALLNAAYGAALSRYRRRGGDDAQIHPDDDGTCACRRRYHAGGDPPHRNGVVEHAPEGDLRKYLDCHPALRHAARTLRPADRHRGPGPDRSSRDPFAVRYRPETTAGCWRERRLTCGPASRRVRSRHHESALHATDKSRGDRRACSFLRRFRDQRRRNEAHVAPPRENA